MRWVPPYCSTGTRSQMYSATCIGLPIYPRPRASSRRCLSAFCRCCTRGGAPAPSRRRSHLSLGLARRGAAVRFVCPPDSEVEALARAGGLEVLPLALRPGARRANAAALAALLARHPVDLVNSQSARDRQALTWLGLLGRLPVPLVLTRRQMPRTFYLENWLAGGRRRGSSP